MSTPAKLQPDPFEQLKKILEDAHRGHDFLAEYVGELERRRNEEDVFIRRAFENVSVGGAIGRGDTFIVSLMSELYDPLDAEHKLEMRRWWHENVRAEASQFDDLKTRLTKIV
jgi:hypothetical protein